MIEKIATTLTNVKQVEDVVIDGGVEIQETSQVVSKGANVQAASVDRFHHQWKK